LQPVLHTQNKGANFDRGNVGTFLEFIGIVELKGGLSGAKGLMQGIHGEVELVAGERARIENGGNGRVGPFTEKEIAHNVT